MSYGGQQCWIPPQTGVHRNSGTRDDKRNPPSGAVLSISQNPWTMSFGKMTGSFALMAAGCGLRGSHECACQDHSKKRIRPGGKW
ncbi:hypothetical protein VN97_g2345 [Penicillium thymicola]|uniref:Uncharacterized protein n=1 Tax=Penicillium thymicola TaxID=293382 RepID=A0AAI9TPN7_PENTH|nr:hypothetical protein VN97_g2345 [Penicillium thymicola]